ncbi:hypothetical protein HQ39_02300 [Porphyromonas sp. COT-108 OH2963]|nr:hypothetical protein JT26_05025 [Porphyromonas sp. COT-108 OH1349]KGN96186.1 hypothetical protein HQ39_02300 [Porphyromonas sp. COT-108 OH2963]
MPDTKPCCKGFTKIVIFSVKEGRDVPSSGTLLGSFKENFYIKTESRSSSFLLRFFSRLEGMKK